ncbi:hypothetical protein ACTJKC_02680 [Pedobacter sp. 22226]|uniref:hypothetical protein n=1 Tax=Pedobacter sp. 22226 TaxID=3453894 RepID=UPI003F879BA3
MSGKIGLGQEPGLKPGHKKRAIGVGCILLVLFSMSGWAYGQTFGEFFNQKKTQRKYFAEQLAAIQLYAGYIKKGYEIGRNGIQAVRDITSGEFSLHNAFISSLSKVSPVISRHQKVAEVIAMQLEMVSVFRSLAKLDKIEPMTMAYVASVGGSMLESSLSDIEVLIVIITSGKLELDEEERLRRLDELRASVEEKCRFLRWFRDEVISLNHQRDRMLKDASTIGGLYER